MVSISINGKQINNIREWEIKCDKITNTLKLTVTYVSGKPYTKALEECKIEPMLTRENCLLFHKQKHTYYPISEAIEIGGKYFIIKYPTSDKQYVMKMSLYDIFDSTELKDKDVFHYFKNIAEERVQLAQGEASSMIAENIVRQFDKLVSIDETALHAYMNKKVKKTKERENLIYPFGINETQLEAVKNAFTSQISIIEGPPGTGKTQTILNIIANIITDGKTCAIVSNNNPAVENVYEKLAKKQLDFMIAKLGNSTNKDDFFNNIQYQKPTIDVPLIGLSEIKESFDKLSNYLVAKNRLALIVSEINEIETEKEYLLSWHQENLDVEIKLIEKYKLDTYAAVNLLSYLRNLSKQFISFKEKFNLLMKYRIFKQKFLNDPIERRNFLFSLQYTFYEKMLNERNKEKKGIEQELEAVDFEQNLEKLQELSLYYLYQYINVNLPNTSLDFKKDNYKNDFGTFMKYFPIIGSSTHSLMNSIADGYLLDYVIIDEASQQDIVPGILCLGCTRNVIVVGDRKQLPHIPTPSDIQCPDHYYDAIRYSLLDSVSEIFKEHVPNTLLKEHYRCHPKIIQFCNKQFYNNELIPMTTDDGEHALSLVLTAKGNHYRKNTNQREIDSVLKVQEISGFLSENIGFIAPYNAQVQLAKKSLPQHMIKDTIHKFQGRECDEIIFSTVLDEKQSIHYQLAFVDNASLVNVAVSRAKYNFTLVTGEQVFKRSNAHIAALIRYMKYYALEEDQYDSPVISAFDLLYKEYDASLEKLNSRLRSKDSRFKSEQIVTTLLREILEEEAFQSLTFHKQIYLRQIVSIESNDFSERELSYMKNGASCDLVIYYKIGKQPLTVIEIDGGYHDDPVQKERDELKNSILAKGGINILRLATTSSNLIIRMKQHINDSIVATNEELF